MKTILSALRISTEGMFEVLAVALCFLICDAFGEGMNPSPTEEPDPRERSPKGLTKSLSESPYLP